MKVPIPAMVWLRAYDRAWLRGDLVAGVTSAAVVIPQAMAYADIAGLPLAVGLYTALVPLVIYAVMGTSRPLSVTTTSTIAILTAGVTAVMVLAVLLFLAPLIHLMPQATLAAVVAVSCAGMIRPPELRAILRTRVMEFSWAIASLAGVVLLGINRRTKQAYEL